MSRKDTIEAEVLDAAYANHGGESSWAAFGAGRMDPAEIVERMEAGEVLDRDKFDKLNQTYFQITRLLTP